jgi:hypothetical protein
MWSAMKSAMGLGSTVDDPSLETSGINAATDWTYDTWRRVSSMTGPEVQLETGTGRRQTQYYYTKLANGHRVTLSCAHMPFNQFGAPVSIAVYDRDGRRVTSAMAVAGASGYLSSLVDTGGATLEAAFNGDLFERRSWEYAGGQVVEEDVWENAENAEAPRYRTHSEYDNGILKRRVDADGTIYNWTKVYSQNGYYIEQSIGDVGEAVVTARTYYNFTYGDLDSHPVDEEVAYTDGTNTIRRTHTFDWRNRLSTTKLDGKNWVSVYAYDWANRVISEDTFYDADDNKVYGGADDRRIGMTVTYYDAAGRAIGACRTKATPPPPRRQSRMKGRPDTGTTLRGAPSRPACRQGSCARRPTTAWGGRSTSTRAMMMTA